MSTVLVIDANCDLPKEVIDEHRFVVLPVTLEVDGQKIVNQRDPQVMGDVYRRQAFANASTFYSDPPLKEVKDVLSREVLGKQPYALVQTMSRTQADSYNKVTDAVSDFMRQDTTKFKLVASKVLFAGQGVLAAETAELIRAGKTVNQVRKEMDMLSDFLYTYTVITDIGYVRRRGKERGEKTANFLQAGIGKLFSTNPIQMFHKDRSEVVDTSTRGFKNAVQKLVNTCITQMRIGLKSKYIVVSYAGELAELNAMEPILELKNTATQLGYTLYCTHMGFGGGYHFGSGTLCIGFAANAHVLD